MNTTTIQKRIENLTADTPAKFGIMTAQHMIEHLIITQKLSYGKIRLPAFEPSEQQLLQKKTLLYTEIAFPKGIKAPGLPETLLDLKHPNLQIAKTEFLKSIEEYQDTFKLHKDLTTIHPRFGPLSFEEWELFHSKHIDHHLKQFGI
jgi:oxepin-CoA hydrolase/3-oxo-5,6-dehydrosuberyl-CoA semialdehyde dehydrogenase